MFKVQFVFPSTGVVQGEMQDEFGLALFCDADEARREAEARGYSPSIFSVRDHIPTERDLKSIRARFDAAYASLDQPHQIGENGVDWTEVEWNDVIKTQAHAQAEYARHS
jgi:hypothetical protein